MKKNLLKILSLVLAVAFSTIAQATPTPKLQHNNYVDSSSTVNQNATIDLTTTLTENYTSSGSALDKVIVGDFDCDGYDDVVVAASNYQGKGAVFIHSGSASSISSGNVATGATYVITGSTTGMFFGKDIVKIEDLDSANGGDSDSNSLDCPELLVLAAPSSTSETVYLFNSATIHSWGSGSTQTNGDSDSILSRADQGENYLYLHNAGKIEGTSNGAGEYLALCSNFKNTCRFFPVSSFLSYSSTSPGVIDDHEEFTVGAAGIHESLAHGDLNGDGIEDLILGAYAQSIPGVLILYGPISNSFGSTFDSNNDFDLVGEDGTPTGNPPSDDNLWIEEESHANQSSSHGVNDGNFGSYVGVIDVNNDEQDELIIGYPYDFNSSYGTYYIISGFEVVSGDPNDSSSSSITNVLYTGTTDGTYNFGNSGLEIIEYHGANSHTVVGFPNSAVVGNFNGDDYDDIAWGGGVNDSSINEGELNVLFGGNFQNLLAPYNSSLNPITMSAAHIEGYIEPDLANTFVDNQGNDIEILDFLGSSNAVGDIDGDGLDELVVLASSASYDYNNEDYYAEVYVFDFPDNHDTDNDGQYVADGDCNDMNPDVMLVTWYADADGDGYGDANTSVESCEQPTGYIAYDPTLDFDCDDTSLYVNPAQQEICDGIDNDCNQQVDESSALDVLTWYADDDGDGFGNVNVSIQSCTQPEGYVADNTDCDDDDEDLTADCSNSSKTKEPDTGCRLSNPSSPFSAEAVILLVSVYGFMIFMRARFSKKGVYSPSFEK